MSKNVSKIVPKVPYLYLLKMRSSPRFISNTANYLECGSFERTVDFRKDKLYKNIKTVHINCGTSTKWCCYVEASVEDYHNTIVNKFKTNPETHLPLQQKIRTKTYGKIFRIAAFKKVKRKQYFQTRNMKEVHRHQDMLQNLARKRNILIYFNGVDRQEWVQIQQLLIINKACTYKKIDNQFNEMWIIWKYRNPP